MDEQKGFCPSKTIRGSLVLISLITSVCFVFEGMIALFFCSLGSGNYETSMKYGRNLRVRRQTMPGKGEGRVITHELFVFGYNDVSLFSSNTFISIVITWSNPIATCIGWCVSLLLIYFSQLIFGFKLCLWHLL